MATLFKRKTDIFQDKLADDSKIDQSATVNEDSKSHRVNNGSEGSSSAKGTGQIKKKRMIEKKLKNILKRIFIHSIFLTFLFITAFSVRDNNSYNYQAALNNIFIDSDFSLV
jgi:acid stress-induced BolA-like protein IbaG/YrbA